MSEHYVRVFRWPGEGRKPLSVRQWSLTGPPVDGIRLSVQPIGHESFIPTRSDLHQRGWPFHHIRHIDALRRPDHRSMAAVPFLLQTEVLLPCPVARATGPLGPPTSVGPHTLVERGLSSASSLAGGHRRPSASSWPIMILSGGY